MELVHATNADKTNVTSFAVTFGIPSDAPRHPDPGCRPARSLHAFTAHRLQLNRPIIWPFHETRRAILQGWEAKE
jgi:hypothetical protein